MSDNSHANGSLDAGSTLLGFALGAAIGAGIALLLAPESGEKTRHRLASTAQRWTKNAEHTLEQARDSVTDLGADAKAAVKAGQTAFQHDRAARESSTVGA